MASYLRSPLNSTLETRAVYWPRGFPPRGLNDTRTSVRLNYHWCAAAGGPPTNISGTGHQRTATYRKSITTPASRRPKSLPFPRYGTFHGMLQIGTM